MMPRDCGDNRRERELSVKGRSIQLFVLTTVGLVLFRCSPSARYTFQVAGTPSPWPWQWPC